MLGRFNASSYLGKIWVTTSFACFLVIPAQALATSPVSPVSTPDERVGNLPPAVTPFH